MNDDQGDIAPSKRSDKVNLARLAKVVAALALAMAGGIAVCWAVMPQRPPTADRTIFPSDMAALGTWKYVVVYPTDLPDGRSADVAQSHFVIQGPPEADGRIVAQPLWTEQKTGRHCLPGSAETLSPENCSALNERGIAVVVAGNLDRRAPTRAQMDSLVKLVHALCGRCRVPVTNVLYYPALAAPPGAAAPKLSMAELLARVGEKFRR